MSKKVTILVFIFLLGLSLTVQAETVGSPVGVDFPKGPGVITKDKFIDKGLIPIYITGLTEFVLQKELDHSHASDLEIDGEWYLSKISFAVNDRFRPCILLGASVLDISGDYGDTKINSKGDTNFVLGGGFSWLIAEGISDYNIALALSGLYRHSDLDGEISQPTTAVIDLKTKIAEFNLALTAYKDLTVWNVLLRPYVSIFYADTDVELKFKTNGGAVIYDLDDIDDHRDVGLALGCEKEPLKGLALNAEVRFITETAVTVGATLKF
jgi:opacity protein-like surface antigen